MLENRWWSAEQIAYGIWSFLYNGKHRHGQETCLMGIDQVERAGEKSTDQVLYSSSLEAHHLLVSVYQIC